MTKNKLINSNRIRSEKLAFTMELFALRILLDFSKSTRNSITAQQKENIKKTIYSVSKSA